MPTNAKYKVYNGSSWVEYHFTTNAAQVSQTIGTGFRKFVSASVKVNGVSFGEDSNNNATVTINGSHLNWYNGTKPTTNYLSSVDTVQAAIEALDTAAKAAYDNVPSGILTTANYATTLGSVYQAKDDDLSAIAGLTGTSGFLKKTAANTWSLDDTSYVVTSRTVNSKALSNNIILYGSDIQMAYNNVTTVKAAIDSIASAANGIAKSVVIEASESLDSVYANAAFNTTNPSVEITATSSTNYKLKGFDGNDIELADLKLGDTVFILDTNIPDRWLAEIEISGSNYVYTFCQLETYNMQWAAITGKPTTLSGYGITDASINTTTKVITVGSNTVSPVTGIKIGSSSEISPTNGVVTLPAYPNVDGFVPYNDAGANVDLGQWGLTGDYVEAADGGYNYAKMTYGSIELRNQGGSMALNFPTIVASATKTIATTDQVPIVTVMSGSSGPSNPKTGDIWIQTA